VRQVELGVAALLAVVGVVLMVSGQVGAGVIFVVVGCAVFLLIAAARAVARKGAAVAVTPKTVEVSDDAITVTTARGTRTTPWHSIRSGTENHLGWTLLGTPPVGLVLKRALNAEQRNEFASLSARHVGARLRWAGPTAAPSAAPDDRGQPATEPTV